MKLSNLAKSLLKEIEQKKVDEVISKLKYYKDEHYKNTKFENIIDTLIKLIYQNKYNEAVELFVSSQFHYEIGNTYEKLRDIKNEYYIETHLDKNWGLHSGKFIAYRAGDLNSPRGIFFSIDKKGAEGYGKDVKKYEVTIKNPLVAERVEEVLAKLQNKTRMDIWKSKDRAKDGIKWLQDADKKALMLAKKQGYDSITYTNPSPPALKELVVFNKNQVKEIE